MASVAGLLAHGEPRQPAAPRRRRVRSAAWMPNTATKPQSTKHKPHAIATITNIHPYRRACDDGDDDNDASYNYYVIITAMTMTAAMMQKLMTIVTTIS